MLIGIEATRANKPTKTGVEWYAWHVIQELKRLTVGDPHSWILYSNQVLTSGLEILPENWYEMRIKWPLRYGWTQLRLSYELYRHPIDVLWLPGSTLSRFMPKRTVITVHDVGFHRFPKLYKARQVHIHERAMKEIVRKAARIITVSEFSAREIAEAYKIDPARIAITYNGINITTYRPITERSLVEECLERYHVPEPFFIAVGRMEAKKNIPTLIKAFGEFKRRRGVGDPFYLVLVGAPGFQYDEIRQAINQSEYKTNILELGYVPEHDLPFLLNAATALVHPAWYEGFGLPPIEAMACGCPVISSNAASLPEVLGDAALYFAPSSPEELVTRLSELVEQDDVRERLRTTGITRAAKYTWTATAASTLPVLTQW